MLNTVAQLASLVLFAAIARVFGADASTDAFFLALTLPMVLIGPVVSAIRAVLVPIIAETRAQRPDTQGWLLGNVVLYALVTALAAVAALAIAAPVAVPIAARAMPPETQALVVRLTLLLLPLIVAQSLGAVLSAAYNAVGHFALPAVAAGARHFSALALLLVVHDRFGIASLAIAFVGGAVVQLALLVLRWRSLGIRLRWTMRPTPELQRAVRLAIPLVVASVILYVAVLVTRFFASWLPEGSLTILDYATRIISALMEVLTSGVLVVVLSRWSTLVQSDDEAAFRASLRRSVILVLFVVAPVLAALFALRVPAVTVVLGRSSVEPGLVLATASVLAILLLGVPLDIVARIYTRVFLVRQKTWVNSIAALVRLLVVSLISLMLIRPVGLLGLAIAETAGVASVMFLLVWTADRGQERTLGALSGPLLRTVVYAGAAAVAAGAVNAALSGFPPLLVLGVGSICALVVYAGLARVTRSAELQAFERMKLWRRRRA